MASSENNSTLAIFQSITHYQPLLMQDINLKIKLIDADENQYMTTLINWEGDQLIFLAPLKQRDFILFQLPTHLECTFISKNYIYITQLKVTHASRHESNLIYTAKIVAPLKRVQQRQSFRLDVLIDLYFDVLHTTDQDQDQPIPIRYPGTSVNLSAGGICIVTPYFVAIKQQLIVSFELLGHTFDIPGTVLDVNPNHEKNTYSIRIQFTHTSPKVEDLLTKLLFEKQRLLRQTPSKPLYKKES